ncbi:MULTISPECIES: aspartyl protease family protein [unclassified Isoptericola]|uniref:aspartyl protease family protein n=1 Tax=unclassified Isoptericola TaxID=2623355 RepID=UPI00365BDD5D
MERTTVSIPLEVDRDPEDPRQALPYLTVSVDGRPHRALLDSGAARTAFAAPPGTVTRPAAGAGRGVFGASSERRRWHATIALGGTSLGSFEVADQRDPDGFLLGQDVLSRFRCHYRLADGELVLDGPEPDHAGPIHAEPVYLDPGRHVYLAARWPSGATADVVLDTGASLTVLDAGFAARHPELVEARGTEAGTDTTGETREAALVELAGPAILGHEFAASPAVVVDLSGANATLPRPMDAILGWPLLSQVDWVVDHPRGRAAVVPREGRDA